MITVESIMTRTLHTVGPGFPLGEVLRIMKEHHCRQVPVVEGDRLVGIITDRDIRLAMNSPLVLHERADDQELLERTPTSACMTPAPLTIQADASAALAADLMRTYKFGSLPVLRGDRLIGIVTTSNILTSYMALLARLEE